MTRKASKASKNHGATIRKADTVGLNAGEREAVTAAWSRITQGESTAAVGRFTLATLAARLKSSKADNRRIALLLKPRGTRSKPEALTAQTVTGWLNAHRTYVLVGEAFGFPTHTLDESDAARVDVFRYVWNVATRGGSRERLAKWVAVAAESHVKGRSVLDTLKATDMPAATRKAQPNGGDDKGADDKGTDENQGESTGIESTPTAKAPDILRHTVEYVDAMSDEDVKASADVLRLAIVAAYQALNRVGMMPKAYATETSTGKAYAYAESTVNG